MPRELNSVRQSPVGFRLHVSLDTQTKRAFQEAPVLLHCRFESHVWTWHRSFCPGLYFGERQVEVSGRRICRKLLERAPLAVVMAGVMLVEGRSVEFILENGVRKFEFSKRTIGVFRCALTYMAFQYHSARVN